MTDFKNLAQLSSDALLVVAGGCIVYANPIARNQLGLPADPQTLRHVPVHTLWSPNPLDDALAWEGHERLPATRVALIPGSSPKGPVTLELTATRSLTADGPVYYIKASSVCDAGNPLAERVRTALALSPDAAMVVDAQSLAFLDANPAACAMMGMSIEAVRARGPTTMRRRDGSGTEDFRALYAQLIAHSPQALTHEYDFIAEDGRAVPIAATRQALSVDGRWLIFITWRDISAQVSAQALVQQFKDAFDQTPDATNIIDVQTLSYVYVNEPFLQLVGLPRERVLAGGPASMPKDIVVVDDLAAFLASVVAQHPRALIREKTVTLPNGHQATIESHHQAVFSGGRWLVRGTRVDITQRKQAQLQLELLKAAFNAAPDAILVIDPVTRGYIEVNEAATQLYGLPREQMIAGGSRQNEETSNHLNQVYARVIEQSPLPDTEVRQLNRIDGYQPMIEATRRAMCVDGRWLIVSVNRDITERKARQAHLNMLRAAIDLAPDAFFLIDPQAMQYVDVNRAAGAMYGLSREQVLSMGLLAYVRQVGLYGQDDAQARLQEDYAAVIAQYPKPQVLERSVRLPGRDVVYNENVRKAVPLDGRWLIVSVTRDITERKRQQARMERFAAVLNMSADAVLLVDRASMHIIDLNEAACRMHGYSRDEMLALPPHLSRLDTTQAQLEADYDEAIRHSPEVTHAELTSLRADGSAFVAEVHRQALRGADNEWIIAITIRDITERKTAQARQELLTAAIEAAPDGIAVIDPVTLKYLHVNDAVCRTHAASREQLLALGVDGVFSGQLTPQDIRETYQSVIDKYPLATTQERVIVALDGRSAHYEAIRRAVRVDGRWLIISMNRDITGRKHAEGEIRRRVAELELLREAYDAAVDAIMIADPETLGYYDVNHAAVKLLGVSREELLARGVEASYYSTAGEPFDADRFRKGCRYVISRAPEVLVEVRTVNPLGLGGRDTVIEFSRRAVNIDGRWVIVTLMRDITAAHRAEEEIRLRVAELTRSNQELEQFAYVTSHDLSEPLRMVASYTQLLSKRYADKFDDDGREFIKYAVDGAQRMKQLIDDLLMYSRAGRSKVPMRHIRLDRALDDALANLANAVQRNGATIERGPLPELVCEKAGLTQVFQNLVGNAIKFRGESAPVVRIHAVEDEHFWTISVADNGIGIAPEYFQRIFVIFQRLHARTKYEGTGIGLSICKKIVERHGGQISVTSGPGQGTTFSFTLSKSLSESEPS